VSAAATATRATYAVRASGGVRPVAERLAAGMSGSVVAVRPGERPDDVEIEVELPWEVTGANLVAVAGALLVDRFDFPEVDALRLRSFVPSRRLADALPGPAFGVEGTRRLAAVECGRPIVGSIVKPSVGLTPAETAERVRELALAGLDFAKDDELLASPPYSPLDERVALVTEALEDAAEHTGRRMMFAFNISSHDAGELLDNHDVVARAGGRCVMVSVNQVGLGALVDLRAHASLPIHGHRNGWAMLTRCGSTGIEFGPFAAIWRLAGVDHLHVNGFSGKFWESDRSVTASMLACAEWMHGVRPLLPVVSSGQWGGQAPAQYAATRTVDFMYLAGGGIQGHPDGVAAGVTAVRAAWQATLDGVALTDRAREVPELATAMAFFGGSGGG
jgi:ribulose-bisphosphate carboxylase large chain